MEKKKPILLLKAKGNKKKFKIPYISSDANSKSRNQFPLGKNGYLSEGDIAKLNWTGNERFVKSKLSTLSHISLKNIMVKNYFCNKYLSHSSCNPNTEVLYYYVRT